MWDANHLHVTGVHQCSEIGGEIVFLAYRHQSMEENDLGNALVDNGQRGLRRFDDDDLSVHLFKKRVAQENGLRQIRLNCENEIRFYRCRCPSLHKLWSRVSESVPEEGNADGAPVTF